MNDPANEPRPAFAVQVSATLPEDDVPASASDGGAGAALARGRMAGRYVILSALGAGGMGVVYAAYDPELDRKVALKLLRPRAVSVEQARLLREARTLAKVAHTNVISVFDVGALGDEVFIAMEFVEGVTVTAWLRQRERSIREILDVFAAAARGLAAAHRANIIHRDFKPKTRSPLGHPLFSPTGRILKFRGVLRRGLWRVAPRDAAVLATGWQRAARFLALRLGRSGGSGLPRSINSTRAA